MCTFACSFGLLLACCIFRHGRRREHASGCSQCHTELVCVHNARRMRLSISWRKMDTKKSNLHACTRLCMFLPTANASAITNRPLHETRRHDLLVYRRAENSGFVSHPDSCPACLLGCAASNGYTSVLSCMGPIARAKLASPHQWPSITDTTLLMP